MRCQLFRLSLLAWCATAQQVQHVRIGLLGDCGLVISWSAPSAPSSDLKEVRIEGQSVKSQWESNWQNRTWLGTILPDLKESPVTLRVGDAPPLAVTRVPCTEGHPPSAGPTGVRFAVVGDLGVGLNGSAVLQRIHSEYSGRSSNSSVAGVLHLGDLANNLSSQDGARALHFLEMLEPSVPFMTLPGDRDTWQIYQRLFRTSAAPDQGPWYSFTAGSAKIIMLWTEAIAEADGAWKSRHQEAAERQRRWLEEELRKANTLEARALRPWVIVAGHRPLYCSVLRPTCSSEAAKLRAVLEPLLVKYSVDLYLASHVHAYERTFHVRNGSVCTANGTETCGPVHILNGDAGDPPLKYADLPARFSAHRHPGQPGYGEITVNATTLQYRQLDAVGSVNDQLFMTKTVIDLGAEEEYFLEAVGWLAFATALATGTCGFVKWVHADGLKRRNEAIRHLRTEIAVLSGLPIKAYHEAESLVGDSHDAHGLH